MGQGQSTKGAQQSKYGPRDSGASPGSKHKTKTKHGSTSKSSSTAVPSSQGSRKKKRSREDEREVSQQSHQPPHAHSDRKLPAVPPHATRTHSHTTKTSSIRPPSDRSERKVPALPSRQFSLTKQTSSGGSVVNKHGMIQKYFNLYKDKEEDTILADGMERFCSDLSLDPTEFIVLVLAWKFEASEMCRFTREEFINGCQKMKAYDAKSLQNRFPELLEEARGKNFKELYQFTFSFGLDHSTGQRSLPIDMAIPLWELVFSREKPAVLERWFDFLHESDIRGISRDTWNMFLPFCHNVAPDFSNYDESEAWPSLFDDFVECELTK